MKERLIRIETNLHVIRENLKRHKWSKALTKGDEEFVNLMTDDLKNLISEMDDLREHFRKISELLER